MATVEMRRGPQEYDYYGQPNQRLVCRFLDPSQRITFPNGRAIEHYPLLIVSSTDPREAECREIAGFVPDTTRVTSVDPKMCELQRECGACPRGLTLEDLNGLG